jgi:hypothetical protein
MAAFSAPQGLPTSNPRLVGQDIVFCGLSTPAEQASGVWSLGRNLAFSHGSLSTAEDCSFSIMDTAVVCKSKHWPEDIHSAFYTTQATQNKTLLLRGQSPDFIPAVKLELGRL